MRKAIDSVLAQTYRDFELIIADDGSTDGTRDYLEAIDDPRVRPIWLEHHGLTSARSAALRHVRGEWVAFLDSDDLWLPEKLALQLNRLATHATCRWSCTGYSFVDTDERPLPERSSLLHRPVSGHILESMLKFEIVPSIVTTIVQRSLIQEIGGFDEGISICADFDFMLRLAMRSEICALPESLVLVREHAGRTTAQLRLVDVHVDQERVFRKAAAAATSRRILLICLRQCAGRRASSDRKSLLRSEGCQGCMCGSYPTIKFSDANRVSVQNDRFKMNLIPFSLSTKAAATPAAGRQQASGLGERRPQRFYARVFPDAFKADVANIGDRKPIAPPMNGHRLAISIDHQDAKGIVATAANELRGMAIVDVEVGLARAIGLDRDGERPSRPLDVGQFVGQASDVDRRRIGFEAIRGRGRIGRAIERIVFIGLRWRHEIIVNQPNLLQRQITDVGKEGLEVTDVVFADRAEDGDLGRAL